MPGSMDGARLAHAVRDRWPPIRIIATSAHTRAPKLPEGAKFFPKPVRPHQVVDAMYQMIA